MLKYFYSNLPTEVHVATLNPIGPRIIAQREQSQSKTAAGIILPSSAQEKPTTAKVISAGSTVRSVKAGDIIIYKEYAATEITIDKEEYLVVNEEDVLATVSK